MILTSCINDNPPTTCKLKKKNKLIKMNNYSEFHTKIPDRIEAIVFRLRPNIFEFEKCTF
jgi:hypothetical protein